MTEHTDLGQTPSRMPTTDLGSAFATRAASLAGRLPPLRAVPPTTEDGAAQTTESQPAPRPDATAPAQLDPSPPRGQTPRPSTNTRAVAPKKQTTPSGAPQTVVVYVPVSIRDRLRNAAAAGLTHTEVALAAIDATHSDLAEDFARNRRASTSLFSGGTPRRLRHDEPQVQVSLRLIRDDLAVIDDLVASCGAPNRSAFVTQALRRYLRD